MSELCAYFEFALDFVGAVDGPGLEIAHGNLQVDHEFLEDLQIVVLCALLVEASAFASVDALFRVRQQTVEDRLQ